MKATGLFLERNGWCQDEWKSGRWEEEVEWICWKRVHGTGLGAKIFALDERITSKSARYSRRIFKEIYLRNIHMRYFFFKKIDSTNFSNSNNPNCTNDVKFVVMQWKFGGMPRQRLCNVALINLINFIFANDANFICPFVLIGPFPLFPLVQTPRSEFTCDMKHSWCIATYLNETYLPGIYVLGTEERKKRPESVPTELWTNFNLHRHQREF